MNTIITSLDKAEKTRLVLHNISELPPIPKVIREALKLLEGENTSIFHLSKVIAQDQSLVTKILAIANSPFYGLQRKIANVEFALTIIGISEVRNIISTLTMLETFKNKTDRYLNQNEFWVHSFISGLAAKKLADELNILNSSEAFIAGFLHEVGVSVMHRFFHSSFVHVHELFSSGEMSVTEAEIEVMGMSHARIGFELLEKWNFPVELCEAILYHHEPSEYEKSSKLPALLNLVDYMTQTIKVGDFKWDNGITLNTKTAGDLGLDTPGAVEELIENYKDSFKQQYESIRFLA